MSIVTVENLTKAFGIKPLFQSIRFVVNEGERVGLIGPNGAGKSTLLKIIAGQLSPDEGQVVFRKGVRIGFLEQTPALAPERTVSESIQEVASSLNRDPEALVGEVMSHLELGQWAERRVGELSGGWKKRVALACELAKEPDLLLLDEPTNHLDISSILWLENWLSRSRLTVVTITHDRAFLRNVTNRILELDSRNPNGLLSVQGDYAKYLERKQELLANQQRRQETLSNVLRRETEWLMRGAKARTTKQKARIQAAEGLQQTVQELKDRNRSRTTSLDFQSTQSPKRLIEAQQVSKSRNGQPLFENLNFFLGPGDRIGILGQNGCGKSTLIRVLLGTEPVDKGAIIRADRLEVAYFEQNRDALDPTKTLRQTICPYGEQVIFRNTPVHINGYLDRFLFRREQADLPIGKLSGGEQSRVLLALLMLKPANVLVLDEPTNDLDVETLDVLQDCLMGFEGGVLLVTHDRYFLDQVATEIQAFPDLETPKKSIIQFADLAQWENWTKDNPVAKKPAENKPDAVSASAEKKRKLSYKETRELEQIEPKIGEAETRLKEVERQTQLPENLSNASRLSSLFAEMNEIQTEIDRLYARWDELS